MKHAAFACCALAVLVACQTVPVPDPGMTDGPDPAACGADALQGLVGQPATVLQTMRFSQETRIIRPDMAVTMDFRPDRLNIDIDGAERITRVYCT